MCQRCRDMADADRIRDAEERERRVRRQYEEDLYMFEPGASFRPTITAGPMGYTKAEGRQIQEELLAQMRGTAEKAKEKPRYFWTAHLTDNRDTSAQSVKEMFRQDHDAPTDVLMMKAWEDFRVNMRLEISRMTPDGKYAEGGQLRYRHWYMGVFKFTVPVPPEKFDAAALQYLRTKIEFKVTREIPGSVGETPIVDGKAAVIAEQIRKGSRSRQSVSETLEAAQPLTGVPVANRGFSVALERAERVPVGKVGGRTKNVADTGTVMSFDS